MIHSFNNERDIIFTSDLTNADLKAISQGKDSFLQDNMNSNLMSMLEPEVFASWKRSKKMNIDSEMKKLPYTLKPTEIKALLRDKKEYIELSKLYFYGLLSILNIPKTSLCIQDEDGTVLDLSDHDKLFNLNLNIGSIWREETVGTTSTSLCLEYGKIVQLAGSRHYCKALENQLATTTPIYDSNGTRRGLITIINDISEISLNPENIHWILCWITASRIMLETKIALLQHSYRLNQEPFLPELEKKNEHNCSEKYLVKDSCFSSILGQSLQIKEVIQKAERFAQTDSSILLTGESGTGKELFAQAIHRASKRSGSFVAINCAVYPANLIASELFGYVGGAFTGAGNKGRVGKVEMAANGTLFLDEIGDMPLEIQPTFLRLLEDKKVTPLGSNRDAYVNFRLIAATNADLIQLVQEKKFRADLYYRLETLQLELPPLRERGRDILLIANYFLEEICAKTGQAAPKLNKDTEMFMLGYSWPGNIRQVKNAMHYAANICQGQVITLQDLPPSVYRELDMSLPNEKIVTFQPIVSLKEMEQEAIKKALSLAGNNVRVAAKMLGISKTSFYRKINDYDINI
ncbi:MAG: sigma 54-interacting transcriptional regulator [Eubacteriales bacterium]